MKEKEEKDPYERILRNYCNDEREYDIEYLEYDLLEFYQFKHSLFNSNF